MKRHQPLWEEGGFPIRPSVRLSVCPSVRHQLNHMKIIRKNIKKRRVLLVLSNMIFVFLLFHI